MTKFEFLKKLKKNLTGIPKAEAQERIVFYSEMIDDRIEEGLSESEAVLAVGSAEKIAEEIKMETDSHTKASKSAKKATLGPWELTFLIIGSPLWASILAVIGAVLLSIWAVLWSVNIVLWAIEIPFIIFAFIAKYLFTACKKTSEYSILITQKSISIIKRAFKKF